VPGDKYLSGSQEALSVFRTLPDLMTPLLSLLKGGSVNLKKVKALIIGQIIMLTVDHNWRTPNRQGRVLLGNSPPIRQFIDEFSTWVFFDSKMQEGLKTFFSYLSAFITCVKKYFKGESPAIGSFSNVQHDENQNKFLGQGAMDKIIYQAKTAF
jgi:hypothetical protein